MPITQQLSSRAKRFDPVRSPPLNRTTTQPVNLSTITRYTALAGVLSAQPLLAQAVSISAIADGDLVVTTGNTTGATSVVTAASGQDLSTGLLLETLPLPAQTAQAQAQTGLFVHQDANSAGARMHSVAWTAASGNGMPFAGTGTSRILVQVTLHQSMTLDVSFRASVIACATAPTGRAWVDIGNDGTIDAQATPGASLFGIESHNLTVTMPAGTTDILLGTELVLPAIDTFGQVVETVAGFTIEPGHASILWEGVSCGAQLNAEPLLNGDVRFWVGGQQLGDLPFLIIGNNRNAQPFPIVPGCNLLVTPDVLIPLPTWSYHHVPMAGLNGQLFAQGALLRPQALFLSPAGLFTSQRIAIGLQ